MTTTLRDGIAVSTLSCGLRLAIEPIAAARSVAVAWLLPVGSASFPDSQDGHAALLAELIQRGAGELDARAHSDALDRLGVQRSTSVLTHHMQIGATMLGSRLHDALPLLAGMITAPLLPATALDAARSLALQSLEGLDDDPQELAMLRLKEHHLAPPFNRHGHGREEALEAATIESLRAGWSRLAVPQGSILGIAGGVDPSAVESQLESLLGTWHGAAEDPKPTAPPHRGSHHEVHETAQTHLAVAWDAPRESDPHSMRERLLVRVLGSGSSSRLFSEVREKRGLCYSVFASYSSGRDTGLVMLYAGSTPQRAQQTLEVSMEQVGRLGQDLRRDEFTRAVTGLKSRLVMQGESTGARAASIAGDLYRLGRARSLESIAAEVDRVSYDDLVAYAAGRRVGPLTLVTIGPAALDLPAS